MKIKALANPTKFRSLSEARTPRAGYQWRNPLFLGGLAIVALLPGASIWIHHASEQALRDRLSEVLEAVAETNAAGMRLLIEKELDIANHWAELPEVLEAAKRLPVVARLCGRGARVEVCCWL